MFEEFELDGCIAVPEPMTLEQFFDEFDKMLDANGWTYGGGLNGYKGE